MVLPHRPVKCRFQNLPFILDARIFENTQNLTLDTDLAPLDLLGHIPGAKNFEALYDRATPTELNGILLRIASLEDIIARKTVANRLKDRNHIAELLELKRLKSTNEDET